MLLVFGLLVTVAAVQTSRNASASDASRTSLIEQINLRRDGLNDVQKRLDREQARALALQTKTNDLTDDGAGSPSTSRAARPPHRFRAGQGSWYPGDGEQRSRQRGQPARP